MDALGAVSVTTFVVTTPTATPIMSLVTIMPSPALLPEPQGLSG
jgi:hypothetical protein